MKVEQLRIGDVLPYARNAREHSPEQVAQIAASLKEFGWTFPVLVDKANVLIAGHGRVLAAATLGMELVPAIRRADMTEEQVKAYRIADNQLALNSSWNLELLKLEVEELSTAGFTLELTGFDQGSLDSLLAIGSGDTLTNQKGHDFDNKLGNYLDSDVRVLQLAYPHAVATKVTAALAKCSQQNGLESNAAAVLYLLTEGGYLADT